MRKEHLKEDILKLVNQVLPEDKQFTLHQDTSVNSYFGSPDDLLDDFLETFGELVADTYDVDLNEQFTS